MCNTLLTNIDNKWAAEVFLTKIKEKHAANLSVIVNLKPARCKQVSKSPGRISEKIASINQNNYFR